MGVKNIAISFLISTITVLIRVIVVLKSLWKRFILWFGLVVPQNILRGFVLLNNDGVISINSDVLDEDSDKIAIAITSANDNGVSHTERVIWWMSFNNPKADDLLTYIDCTNVEIIFNLGTKPTNRKIISITLRLQDGNIELITDNGKEVELEFGLIPFGEIIDSR